VGLPLAVHAATHFPVTGLDVSANRVNELSQGYDRTREITSDELAKAGNLRFSTVIDDLADCNFYIVTVPTPITSALQPDLTALQKASETVGTVLKKGDVVVYESTVYPGVTEDVCVPILAKISGLIFNVDFFAGYSPERINPGDRKHRLPDIRKVTSGSTPEAADLVDRVYRAIITAGTHRAGSIRVAEAAKVIENIQRDVNIALINELAMLFRQLGLETAEVLAAAGTKWNFHAYVPGLVGGHCIGVDPYYLTHKAQTVGFHPEMILAGRRINDGMAAWIAQDILKSMLRRRLRVDGARILVMGFSFKENCADVRNTKVADLVGELSSLTASLVEVFDPVADPQQVQQEYGIQMRNKLPDGPYDCIVLAVRHDEICALGDVRLRKLLTPSGLLYDLKSVLPRETSDVRL
jgi:UDP-N-acetyl-D-glucosamine/UDP-N-acetyl-D-galactosamine dehydrogenase